MKRLMIVADNSTVLQAIRLALRQTSGFQVIGFVDGRVSARHHLLRVQPDVVLVDDMQEPGDALDRIREIAEAAPAAKIVLLTSRMDEQTLREAFAAGAHAAISKTVHPVTLGTLLREVSHGNVVHRYEAPRVAVADLPWPLTERELEILRLVAEGYTNGRVARELWVTEQTVKFHLSNTFRKLGVTNRTEASRFAHLHDLVAHREPIAS